MHQFAKSILLSILLSTVCPSGFSQLRYSSEYSVDRINTEQTSFTLHDSGAAEYQCASEWTTLTIQTNLPKTVLFVWHFGDGSKAFARQVEYVGDIGVRTEFLLANQSSNLEDKQGKKIQPMTRDNHPVRVELWIGEYEDSKGHLPEVLIDKVCLDAVTIEYDKPYRFKGCP